MSPDATTRRAAVYGRESHNLAKSIEDQVAEGAEAVTEQGWTHAGSYDDGTSASRYATKTREGWQRLLADLRAGAFDVLVLWETTRGSREPIDWFTLLNTCRNRGVLIHVVSDDRTYDPRRARDYKDLATAGVDGAYETDRTSERVQRGHRAAAKGGRPAMGQPPFGYRRRYDPRTGELLGQEPDPQTAPIVKRIFTDLARLVPITAVARALTAEGIRPPARVRDHREGRPWEPTRVREIAKNPAYIGLRVHQQQGRNANSTPQTYPGGWEPLVDEEVFYAVQAILGGAGRRTNPERPGKQVHLLSFLGTCHRGHPLVAATGGLYYTCRPHGCVKISKEPTDEFVERMIRAALVEPEIYGRLRRVGETTSRELQEARNEVAALKQRLGDWRKSAARGQTTPESLAEIEAELAPMIEEAQRRADTVPLSPALRPFIEPGVDVEARWASATLPARRDVIRDLAEVRVSPAITRGRGFDFWRLRDSRWVGDTRTWGDIWAAEGV
jgi:site-specific DNA recombinase